MSYRSRAQQKRRERRALKRKRRGLSAAERRRRHTPDATEIGRRMLADASVRGLVALHGSKTR